MSGDDHPARQWLLSRVDKGALAAVDELLSAIAEHLAVATSDAVTIRVVSADGMWLLPVAAQHPTDDRRQAMIRVMGETAQAADAGLWLPVINDRRPVRWYLPDGDPPREASSEQVAFMKRNPVRAILGAPVCDLDGSVIGGVSVVRFGVDLPYTSDDEALVVACAERIAAVLRLRNDVLARRRET